ncbi:MAG TPA: tRNA lysidine(34) synthetase TilS [archaeon]|nr:tRNA lysidine(34) synthetase TilS [archaeon]
MDDTIKCDKCQKPAIIYLAYGKHNYCKEHFNEFFEKRLKKTIRTYKLIRPNEKIGIAVSGGKDSMVLLYLLNKFYKNTNVKISVIFIDEGIKRYSDKAKKVIQNFCKKNKIQFLVTSHKKEYGITTQEIAKIYDKKIGTICTYCGVLRRKAINKLSKKEQFSKIATAHNLDDETQTILMNLLDNDHIRLFRTGPTAGLIELNETTPRIKPFYLTPEKEIGAYALYNNIPFFSEDCPYYSEAKRNDIREILNNLETKYPGTKFSLIRSFLKIKELINIEEITNNQKTQTKKCKICGETTSQEICKSCLLITELRKTKKGPVV